MVYSVSERGREVFTCAIECLQCRGKTAEGRRCSRTSCIGTPFCWTHAQKLLGLKVADYPGLGKGIMAVKRSGRSRPGQGQGPREVIFKKGEFIMPYIGEMLTPEEYNRRYVDGNEDSLAEYVIEDGEGRHVDGACKRRLPALANTVLGKKQRVATELPPMDGAPIRYLSSVLAGTNCKFTVRTASHQWHGIQVPAKSAWFIATKPIREGDQILAYYGDNYRVYTNPGYQVGTTKRKNLPVR